MRKRFNVVAAGRAYTDIIANASTDFLLQYQIPLDDQRECSVAELKKIQEALTAKQFFPGGPSANTLAMLSTLGAKTGYFGKIYQDAAGQSFQEDFTQRKIEWCCSPNITHPEMSATCVVLVTGEQRSFIYNPGCGDYFSPVDFNQFDFRSSEYFLVEAHLLTSSVAKKIITGALNQAKNNCDIVINLQGITNWHDSNIAELIHSHANIIVGNEREQSAFAKTLSSSHQEAQIIVTTKGPAGADFQQGDYNYHAPAVTPKVFINSVGAGDAFIAGLLFGLSSEMSIADSMQCAVQTAAAILEESGARPLHH
jgi:sugar/nucleoside kinase (ribokinase family)